MLLSECEKAALASDFAALLIQPCIIQRPWAPVKDAFGSSSVAYTQTHTMCRVLALKSPREGIQGAQIASQATQQILLPLSTSVSPRDTLISQGIKYNIVATDHGKTDALYLTVDASKVA